MRDAARPVFIGQLLRAHRSEGIALEQPNRSGDRRRIDLEGMAVGGTREPQGGVTTRVGLDVELSAVSVSDPLR